MRPGVRAWLAVALVMAAVVWSGQAGAEVRALWATRMSLTSPESVRELVEAARSAGFDTIIAQVRGRGDSFHRSELEPRSVLLAGQPETFDPLQLLLEAAHGAGLRVHAWVNTYVLANLAELPTDKAHLYWRRPEWMMVPRLAAEDVMRMDPTAPGYRDGFRELVTAASRRLDQRELEGLYLSPAHPEVRAHLLAIWLDIVRRYDVDGMHFDFVRYPNPEFDFNPAALDGFRAWLTVRRPEARADSGAGPAAGVEAARLPSRYPDEWRAFLAAQVTATVEAIYRRVKEERPRVMVTAAVFPEAADAEARRFQEWRTWLAKGILDGVCPMAYTADTAVFRRQIAAAREASNGREVWAGIGAWRLPEESITDKIAAARELGAEGFSLFSYDGLSRPSEFSPGGERLSRLGLGSTR